MRTVYLITVGAFLLTTALAAGKDEQVGETVAARVPRALILQPISKIREEDEDGPLDWLADMFRGMVSPRKKPQYQQPPMLGPIRIPGVDDEVYIKQLGSLSNAQSRVVVRVMKPQRAQMPGKKAISPTSYYTYQPVFPVAPTRQMPMQSGGIVPMPSPPPTAPWTQSQAMRQHYPMNYNKNMHPSGYNYLPPNMYHHQHHHQYRPMHQSYQYDPYNPRYPQNPYGTYDIDNSILHSGRGSSYGGDPLRTTNYPLYPPLKEHSQVHHDNQGIQNETASSDEVYDNSQESNVRYADASTETLPESVTDKYREIYRPDRMVPTNPTWRNRFWTRTVRTTTVSPTTETADDDKRHKSSRDSPKFSSTEIKEIVAPNLKDWKVKNEKPDKEKTRRTPDSRMDDEGIEIKDGTILGRGESQEYTGKRYMNVSPTKLATKKPRVYERISSRKRNNWMPIEPKSTQSYPVYSSPKNKDNSSEITSSTEAVTPGPPTTPEMADKVAGQTGDNLSRHQEGKRPSKTHRRRTGKSNRRVRIVESVSSSVSMTSSRGKGLTLKSS